MKRRKFITGVATSMAVAPFISNAFYLSPNDKIQIAVIGCNGMGWSNVRSLLKMPDIDLVALCDVDKNVIQRRLSDYKKLRKNRPKIYSDYRELLLDKSIDAVVIGTPDHWHCKQMVDSIMAGKHVYVEKPISTYIDEAETMVKAAKKYPGVIQTGQWQRSGTHYQKAIDIVSSGVLGTIRLVKVWAYQGWVGAVPKAADSDPPAGVDYQMWLGPAPDRPFNKNRFHFNFRWYWDYAGGLMTDWGVHEIDIALWGMQATTPKSIMASGGKFAYPDDASETPDTLQAVYEFDSFNMLWEHATGIDLGPYGKREGIAFVGNNGTLVVNREGYEVLIEREGLGYSTWGEPKMEFIESVKVEEGVSYLDMHTQNFIAAVKANDPSLLNTPIEKGSLTAINAQMGNIAFRTGTRLFWDEKKSVFTGNERANQLRTSTYYNGWEKPMF